MDVLQLCDFVECAECGSHVVQDEQAHFITSLIYDARMSPSQGYALILIFSGCHFWGMHEPGFYAFK